LGGDGPSSRRYKDLWSPEDRTEDARTCAKIRKREHSFLIFHHLTSVELVRKRESVNFSYIGALSFPFEAQGQVERLAPKPPQEIYPFILPSTAILLFI